VSGVHRPVGALCEVVILVRFRPKEDIQGEIRLSHFARGDFRWSEL